MNTAHRKKGIRWGFEEIWYWIIKHQCIMGWVRVGHMGLTGCEQWAGKGAPTWLAAGPMHPGGWYMPTGAGGRRCQADMPTPSWGRWRGSGASGCSQRGRSNAFPTADACAPESTCQNADREVMTCSALCIRYLMPSSQLVQVCQYTRTVKVYRILKRGRESRIISI